MNPGTNGGTIWMEDKVKVMILYNTKDANMCTIVNKKTEGLYLAHLSKLLCY